QCDGDKTNSEVCSNCRRRGVKCTFNAPVRKRGPRPRSRHQTPSTGDSNIHQERLPGTPSEIENIGDTRPMSLASPAVPSISAPSPGHFPPDRHLHPLSSPFVPVPPPPSAADDILQRLLQILPSASGRTPADLSAECIDLYLRHLFPITPLVHEASIRATWTRTFEYGRAPLTPEPYAASPATNGSVSGEGFTDWPYQRDLALLTAICATASSLLPSHLFASGQLVAGHFLKASRDLLRLHQDQDIERPKAASVIVRYLHSISTHALGNTRVSWYIMGEAIRLALEMRLYDEATLAGLDPVEAQLRRSVYWQLHTGDRSAAILNERPFSLHQLTLDAPLSLRQLGDEDVHLLDARKPWNTPAFVQCINAGFNLSTRLFTTAATVLVGLRLLEDFAASPSGAADLVRGQEAAMVDAVLDFRRVLDDVPPWLERPWLAELGDDADSADRQRDALWAQHVNLKLTFHCLRLILLQRAATAGRASLLGFGDNQRLLTMQETDVARDMLACIQAAPFQALQINGEPCVEKIRQAGASLLRISQGGEPHVAERARGDFQVLLNILTRLDSKVSAAMCQDVVME
ncbi:hypothetical protein F5X68DRAFT_141104, partial [Plectosphaerella plurivora]